MTPAESIALMNPIAALAAGAIASLHCVGMCGPLGCSIVLAGNPSGKVFGVATYQFGRVASYGALGLLAGAFGGEMIDVFGGLSPQAVPLALALALLMLVFRVDAKLARFSWVGSMSRAAMTRALKTPPAARGLALGLATPLIPCGLLYSMIWVAALSGEAVSGALIMASFALGAIPALATSLLGYGWLSKRLSAAALFRWQRGLALIAIAVLLARSFLEFDLNALVSGEGFCVTIR